MTLSIANTEEATLKKLDELISAVLNTKLATRIPLKHELWNTQQVADYIGVSYKYASEHIVTNYTFPGVIRLSNSKGTPLVRS